MSQALSDRGTRWLAGREGQNPDHERPHLTLHWGAGAAGPGWPSWGPLADVPASRMVVPTVGWAGLVHAFSVALFLGLFSYPSCRSLL